MEILNTAGLGNILIILHPFSVARLRHFASDVTQCAVIMETDPNWARVGYVMPIWISIAFPVNWKPLFNYGTVTNTLWRTSFLV